MDIVTVHTIKIFVLYVGTIASIQDVYIYLNPLGHTLKSFASIEYEFSIRLQRLYREV
jgi:hypothetical protein